MSIFHYATRPSLLSAKNRRLREAVESAFMDEIAREKGFWRTIAGSKYSTASCEGLHYLHTLAFRLSDCLLVTGTFMLVFMNIKLSPRVDYVGQGCYVV